MAVGVEHALMCHPGAPSGAVSRIVVRLSPSTAGGMLLEYRICGDVDRIILPPVASSDPPLPPESTDGLWRRTCCEAFVACGDAAGYREFNFSPSGEWAVYDFEDYRRRDDRFVSTAAPRIGFDRDAKGFTLRADLPSTCLPTRDAPNSPSSSSSVKPLQVGLAVVVEDVDGALSYWALAHADGPPDFHRRETFELTIE